MEQVKTKSVEPHTRFALPEVNWDELNEAGAYVERGSGDLYRVPKEAIIPGGSPIIHKESAGSSRVVQVSQNPFVTTLEARLRCAQHNIDPSRVGGGALTRWLPSAAQTARAVFPHAVFTKTRDLRCKEKATTKWALLTSGRLSPASSILGR
jgi:hypothetical protein